MSLYIKTKIIGTRSWTSDQDGNTIEQIVAIELPSGQILGVFDGVEMRVTPDMIGKKKDIAIMVLASRNGIEIISEKKYEIIPSQEKFIDFPYHYRNQKYIGKVKDMKVKDIWHRPFEYSRLILVDVGGLEIVAHIDSDAYNKIKENDFVEISGAITEFLDIL
jgi:hypothetical protein